MSNPLSLKAGSMVGPGRFTLIRELGRGGMGVVWLAQDTRLNERVALKFLPPEVAADPAALNDMRHETVRSHRLSHTNIIRIHDFHQQPDGVAFISMEYVDGPTLTVLRLEQSKQVLAWAQLAPLLQQLCAALDYAHGEGVIHRDLKPANVMLDSRGRVKLADLGIAAVVNDSVSRVSAKPSAGGTLAYMSPQQLAGRPPSVPDDLYALGATLYELLTGKPPFYSGDLAHQIMNVLPQPVDERLLDLGIDNPVPPGVAAMVMACLAKEPEQRPQSARAVAEWIGLTIQEQRSGASLVGSVFGEAEPARVAAEQAGAESAAEARHTMSHRRKLQWLGGAVTAAVVLVLGGVWLLSTRFPPRVQKPTQEDRLDQGTTRTDARLQNLRLGQRWTNSLGMVFVPVPGTEVRFSIWETRRQDFEAFVKATGRDMSGPMGSIKDSGAAEPPDGYGWHNPGFAQTSQHPVVGVTWHDARAFCAWLTQMEQEQEQGRLTRAQTYRLPTDAEWSRAVGQGKYPWGDTWPPPAGAGNYAGEEAKDADWPANSGVIAGYRDGFPRTAPVGNFAPNPYGLFDMGGNVWEWCEDVYRREMNLEEVRRKLPFFNDDGSSQKYRVLRGGSWFNDSWNVVLFCSFHHAHVPDSRDARVGFRVVLAGASSGSQP